MPEQNTNQHRELSLLAHDMRTSLTATKWILDMILKGDLGEINIEQKSFLQKAFDTNEELIAKVNKVLSNKTETAQEKPFSDIVKIIQEVLFYFHPLANSKQIEIIFLKNFEALSVNIPPSDLKTVIQNLLDNAIKYSKSGDTIVLSLDETSNEIIFRIRDNGIGISENESTKIFKENFRAQNAVSHTKEGAGMGLFAVKTILEKWGDEISCASQEGKGSVFEIKFTK